MLTPEVFEKVAFAAELSVPAELLPLAPPLLPVELTPLLPAAVPPPLVVAEPELLDLMIIAAPEPLSEVPTESEAEPVLGEAIAGAVLEPDSPPAAELAELPDLMPGVRIIACEGGKSEFALAGGCFFSPSSVSP